MHVFNIFITAVFLYFYSSYDGQRLRVYLIKFLNFLWCCFISALYDPYMRLPEPTILLACGTTMLGCRETGTLLDLCNQANPFHRLWGRPSNLPRMCLVLSFSGHGVWEGNVCSERWEVSSLLTPKNKGILTLLKRNTWLCMMSSIVAK